MSQHVIFPPPSAGANPPTYGWAFTSDYRVALKIKDGTADPSTPAQALGSKLSRDALDRSLAAGEEEPTAPYFYACTENYNPTDPREVDFDAWYGPEPASQGARWDATGWYKAMPERAVVEVMPTGVLLGCAWRGDADGCKNALAHGANPNFRDGSTSVLSAAIEVRSMEVVDLLICAGLDPDQGYGVAELVQPLVESGERALLERLLSFLLPPKDHWSRLLGVSAHPDIADLLEAHGASVEGAGAGILPLREMLQFNERRGRPERLDRPAEMVRWLVFRGADINAVGAYGGTALDMAVRRWEVPAIRALLAHGADPYLVSDGDSAFEIAGQMGQQAAFQALVEECWTAGTIALTAEEPQHALEQSETVLEGKCEAPDGQALEEVSRKRTFFAWLRRR